MQILSAEISGYRNLETTKLTFSPGVNIFLGDNGQGKTNLLESLNFPAYGRSHRGSRHEELIGFSQDNLHVSLTVLDEHEETTSFEYGLDRTGGRRFRINGEVISGRTKLVGRLQTIFFDPESISLVRGSPKNRRTFLDQGLSSLDPDYFHHLRCYQRALRQKASLLREAKKAYFDPGKLHQELKAWNRELAVHAAPVCIGRHSYSHEINPLAAVTYRYLTDAVGDLQFVYHPQLKTAENLLESNEIKAEILSEIDYIVGDEIRRARPLAGPHLDDCEVRLAETDLRTFGSQGETRSAAISLILAQSDLLLKKVEVRPVLFLDDIFSELDRNRAGRLQELAAGNHQVFVATARLDDVADWRPDGMKIWRISNGKIESQE